jgi:site-specific DNA-cytosine methylase
MNVDTALKSPVILSLCPGIRGLERGIEKALGGKLRVAAYVEIEAFIIANLLAGMEAGLLDAAPIWSNLKTFNARPFRGKIHGIIGGYPCQPFSVAGVRKGTSDPRHLYPFISRCIKKSRPLWCLFENVEGHLSLGFDIVQKDLRKMGYAVEAGVYSAEEAGAPHRRNRLFILALENSFSQRMRGRSIKIQAAAESECEVQTPGSSELAHSRYNRYRLLRGCCIERKSEEGPKELLPGSELEHTGIKPGTSSFRGILSEPGRTGEIMGNTNNAGLQRWCCGKCGKCTREWTAGSNGPADPAVHSQRWPARPGEDQYDWEEPRIIEPGMGCTVNGYNFREDFLRALGNSVVEQTAELAFIDLLKKHGISIT